VLSIWFRFLWHFYQHELPTHQQMLRKKSKRKREKYSFSLLYFSYSPIFKSYR